MLTGAGISAESGISTYRDAGGLWENFDYSEVATPAGWRKDRDLVLRFYNDRRRQFLSCEPNPGHTALVELEARYEVQIITQNIDDLHERAGSAQVLHLHGEITKARSTLDPSLVYDWGSRDLNPGDTCEKGSQLRPHIVWFGEDVPLLPKAARLCAEADIMLIIGTSMVVYPANTLVEYAPQGADIWYIDPMEPGQAFSRKVIHLKEKGSVAVPRLVGELLGAQS